MNYKKCAAFFIAATLLSANVATTVMANNYNNSTYGYYYNGQYVNGTVPSQKGPYNYNDGTTGYYNNGSFTTGTFGSGYTSGTYGQIINGYFVTTNTNYNNGVYNGSNGYYNNGYYNNGYYNNGVNHPVYDGSGRPNSNYYNNYYDSAPGPYAKTHTSGTTGYLYNGVFVASAKVTNSNLNSGTYGQIINGYFVAEGNNYNNNNNGYYYNGYYYPYANNNHPVYNANGNAVNQPVINNPVVNAPATNNTNNSVAVEGSSTVISSQIFADAKRVGSDVVINNKDGGAWRFTANNITSPDRSFNPTFSVGGSVQTGKQPTVDNLIANIKARTKNEVTYTVVNVNHNGVMPGRATATIAKPSNFTNGVVTHIYYLGANGVEYKDPASVSNNNLSMNFAIGGQYIVVQGGSAYLPGAR